MEMLPTTENSMKSTVLSSIVLTLSVLLPASILRAADTAVDFRIGGVDFSLPIPDGYCKPAGKGLDVAQAMAATDDLNVTHLLLQNCDPKLSDVDYFILKTPKNALLVNAPRAELLSAMQAEISKPINQEEIFGDKMNQQASAGFDRVFNMKIDMDAAIGPRGYDDTCAYIGGYISYTNITEPYKIAIGMCFTSINSKIMTVNVYGQPKDQTDVARLLARSKLIATSITSKTTPE
jgi:hypothetical protein